jgi:hypothetical protein
MFERNGNIRMEIGPHGPYVGMGNRWLIFLPWLVVGLRCKGFLVGRGLGVMIGLCA